MSVKSLEDLFVHTLKDVLYAEKKILKSLPKMEKKASSDELREAFAEHREETQGQVERLEEIFKTIGKQAKAEKCDAIEGIVEEAEELMEEIEDAETLDAALIASAQAVEHYEMARYGQLIAWAKQLGHQDVVSLLEETLDQEKNADKLLTKLAEGRINKKAA